MTYTQQVEVSQRIKVTVDESKFTTQFMEEFRESFHPFHTIDEHIKHLAQLYARGITGGYPSDFLEGYGPLKDMGIKFEGMGQDEEIV